MRWLPATASAALVSALGTRTRCRCRPLLPCALVLQLVDLRRELFDALPYPGEGDRRRLEPLTGMVGGRGRRRHPGQTRRPAGDRFSDTAAVDLPRYAGRKADDENQQGAAEDERHQLAERQAHFRER